jgi:hypothetical protein
LINHKRPSSFRTNFNYLSGMKSSRFLLTMVRKNPKLRRKLYCIHGIYIYIYIERERERERDLYGCDMKLTLYSLAPILFNFLKKKYRNFFVTDTNLFYVFIFAFPIKYIFVLFLICFSCRKTLSKHNLIFE